MAYKRPNYHSLLALCLVFAALPFAAGISDCALVREVRDARREPLRPVGGLAQTSKKQLFEPFVHTQAAWAIVKTVKQAFGDSVHVADFFAPRKVLERLLLYTCTVVVLRLVEPPTVCQFITTHAVLVGWLACTGRQVAPAFEWQQVLERFGVHLLQLQQGTMRKSADNEVIRQHN